MKKKLILMLSILISLNFFEEVGLADNQTYQKVSDWSASMTQAINKSDVAQVKSLLNFSRLERRLFPKNKMTKDRADMLKARQLFAKKKYNNAIEIYNQIPKTSDYWLEAIEEKSWCYFKLDDPEQSLAQVRTLLAPIFVSSIGPEPFILKSTAEVTICDYKNVFKTLKLFKAEQRERIKSINDLADSGDSKELQEAIEKIDRFPIDSIEVGKSQKLLPRLFWRDRQIQVNLLIKKLSQEGLRLIEKIKSGSLSADNAASQLFTKITIDKKFFEDKIRVSSEIIKSRIMKLAREEASEYFHAVQKLQLAEVEATQRVFTDAGHRPQKGNKIFNKSPDELTFLDDGEVWLDELDKYKAQVNACPTNVRRRM